MMKQIFQFLFLMFVSSSAAHSADENETIKLVFGGDVTLTAAYNDIVPNARDPEYPFKRLRTFFQNADLVMVNCETAITRRGNRVAKQFNFRMDPEMASAFSRAGISLVTIANNHVFDYGVEGLSDTLHTLDALHIGHVGAGMTLEEARKPVVRNIKGKKIVFLAYGNYAAATARTPGTAYRNPDYVVEDVKSAKKNGADIVVINFHWGTELARQPNSGDRALAYRAVEAGADIIVGHHPHVLQPMEIYHGKVIAWSLGNFIFGGNRRSEKESALLEVSISPRGDMSYVSIPIRIDVAETRYQPYIIEHKE
jgi:poly-gamma-glutamate capsule biosynthesis protein CapA/YwtB (metallophosphatase superfamily)